MIHLAVCPVCANNNFVPEFSCQDHLVTREVFSIQRCASCGLLMTNPQPEPGALGKYYESSSYMPHQASGFLGRIYSMARNRAIKWKLNLIEQYQPTGHLLDYGCGTGEFLAYAKRNNWQTSGVEPNPDAQHRANELAGPVALTLEKLQSPPFDIITLWHVLEHIPDISALLKKLQRVLKKTGTIFIAVPNHKSWDAEKYRRDWAGYDVPRHLWHFNKNSMEQLLSNNGFNLTRVVPMKLDAFYVSLLSEQYRKKTGLSKWIPAFLTGMKSNMKAVESGEYSSLIYIAQQAKG